ncbi:RNA polymerase sigma factor [Paucibacter sp. XJ19-41]|uniref:RNA polymerase sigma factor n=1 Tax=Paucibacter sp. XJ19-41 TaxID=2927824 RepID=UPI00234BBE7D|nr:RNA polymerase sigma factor [Paucibacter sp. XJ19-41]MDC6169761.1 RNA polymerase sigma factor [Paucibacter sp. XJ19-41]
MPDLIRDLLLHYRDLLRHLTHRLRNPDDAADIAQSTFEQVYQHAMASPDATTAVESPRALLFRTAHNLCIDQARHRQVVQAWADDRKATQTGQAVLSTEHIAAYRQLVERVVAQLEQLPPRRREVFLLFRAHGHTQTEIAMRLQITEAAVAKHVVRATLDCARAFAELSHELPATPEPSFRPRMPPMLAEEHH